MLRLRFVIGDNARHVIFRRPAPRNRRLRHAGCGPMSIGNTCPSGWMYRPGRDAPLHLGTGQDEIAVLLVGPDGAGREPPPAAGPGCGAVTWYQGRGKPWRPGCSPRSCPSPGMPGPTNGSAARPVELPTALPSGGARGVGDGGVGFVGHRIGADQPGFGDHCTGTWRSRPPSGYDGDRVWRSGSGPERLAWNRLQHAGELGSGRPARRRHRTAGQPGKSAVRLAWRW